MRKMYLKNNPLISISIEGIKSYTKPSNMDGCIRISVKNMEYLQFDGTYEILKFISVIGMLQICQYAYELQTNDEIHAHYSITTDDSSSVDIIKDNVNANNPTLLILTYENIVYPLKMASADISQFLIFIEDEALNIDESYDLYSDITRAADYLYNYDGLGENALAVYIMYQKMEDITDKERERWQITNGNYDIRK